MPKHALLVLKIAVVMTALMLAALGLLDVADVVVHADLKWLALRGLAVIGILTVTAVVVTVVMSVGGSRS